jgi:hypothetical protein
MPFDEDDDDERFVEETVPTVIELFATTGSVCCVKLTNKYFKFKKKQTQDNKL